MTTIRQLMQTSPAKANELLAKLVDTSATAVKTRERLFAELKTELEFLARLEEQHLFPVLKRHRETKKLAIEALSDNRETRKLLAELERTPKDSEDFAAKVADLRKAFQQHVRDEKNELLPAILKALSDEEAEAVVEKIEDKKAEIQAARRAETEERRAETRREREEVEAAEQAAENVANAVRAGADGVQAIARTTQDAVQNGVGTAVDVAQRSMGQLMEVFGLAGQRNGKLAGQVTTPVQAMTESTTLLFRGLQDVSREWLEMSRNMFQTNMEGLNAMARCRSIQDFVAVQSSLIRDNLELTMENGRRLAELSVGVANKAGRRNGQQSMKGVERSKRAA
jgi:hypothetical protein